MSIFSTDLNEMNFTFYLSIRYGFSPDTARFIIENAGKVEALRNFALSRIKKVFTPKFDAELEAAILCAKNVSRREIEAKTGVTIFRAKFCRDKLDDKYTEVKGFLELGLITYEDHEKIKYFIESYAPYSLEAIKEQITRDYKRYLNCEIPKQYLIDKFHMTFAKIEKIVLE